MLTREFLVRIALVLALLGLACEKKSSTGGDFPSYSTDPVTLANAMPGEVGTSWSYEIEAELWRDEINPANIYDEREQAPDALTLDEVIAHAAAVGDLPALDADSGTLDWVVDFALATEDTLAWLMAGDVEWVTPGRASAVLSDARSRLAPRSGSREDYYQYYGTLFVGASHVWRCASWLGYPESFNVEEFPFLTDELDPGDETSIELHSDIFLHFRVLGEQSVVTPAGIFRDALRLFYYFEYPVVGLYDIMEPEPLGYVRALDYGTLDWVAGIGPVKSTSRAMVTVGAAVDEGMGASTAILTDATNLPEE